MAAARLGSFTRAAEQLDVSQPAVAEQVRNLEAILGIELFARAGRGVRPTPAGEAFVERAAAVLAALDEAVSSVDAIAGLAGGTLAFGLFAMPETYSKLRWSPSPSTMPVSTSDGSRAMRCSTLARIRPGPRPR